MKNTLSITKILSQQGVRFWGKQKNWSTFSFHYFLIKSKLGKCDILPSECRKVRKAFSVFVQAYGNLCIFLSLTLLLRDGKDRHR